MSRDRGPRITLPAEPLIDGATLLRGWHQSDAAPLVELCQDPEIVRWVHLPAAYGLDDARDYLGTHEESARLGIAAHFAVCSAADATLLGSISLLRFAWPDRRAEVGYWLGAGARGQGHATRGARLICRWGYRSLGLERIELLAATGNRPSQGVAARAGFTREAVLRAYAEGTGGPEDLVCFGRLVTDPDG